ncbi:MAG: hypothetical protein M0Z44_04210 [Gammaproteobacteria bacterium]|nr:hypothetical protein [Gammaproteobacteria bacterium]
MKFLQNANYEGHLLDILKTGGKVKDIACAVAFWGEHAEKYLKYFGANTRIIRNLESGATNPWFIAKLRKKNMGLRDFVWVTNAAQSRRNAYFYRV